MTSKRIVHTQRLDHAFEVLSQTMYSGGDDGKPAVYQYLVLKSSLLEVTRGHCDDLQVIERMIAAYPDWRILLLRYSVARVLRNDNDAYRMLVCPLQLKSAQSGVRNRSQLFSVIRLIREHYPHRTVAVITSPAYLRDEIVTDARREYAPRRPRHHRIHTLKPQDIEAAAAAMPSASAPAPTTTAAAAVPSSPSSPPPPPTIERKPSFAFEGIPHASFSIDCSNDDVMNALNDVRNVDTPTNWCMFGITDGDSGTANDDSGRRRQRLIPLQCGDNGIDSLASLLPDDQVVYCVVAVQTGHQPRMKRMKSVLIVWNGANSSAHERKKILMKPQISTALQPIHFDYTPSGRSSLVTAHIQRLLQIYTHTDEIMIRMIRMRVVAPDNDDNNNTVPVVETEPPRLVYVDRNISSAAFRQQCIDDNVASEEEASRLRFLILKDSSDSSAQLRYGSSTASIHVIEDSDTAHTLSDHGVVNGMQIFVDISEPHLQSHDRVVLDASHLPVASLRVQGILNALASPPPPPPPVVGSPVRAVKRTVFRVVAAPSPPTPTATRPPSQEPQQRQYVDMEDVEDRESSEIDLDSIAILQYSVGVGRSAVVHHGLWLAHDNNAHDANNNNNSSSGVVAEVALKIFRYNRLSAKIKENFLNEVVMLRRLPPHRNVVMFVGASYNVQRLAIVCEWVPRGCLHDILADDDTKIEPHHVLQMALDIALGMEHLHANHLIHRDLKSHNLLLDEEWTVKVADFGLSKWLSADENAFTTCGTLGWSAPEVFDPPDTGYTNAIDVFSYGIVLWEIVARPQQNPLSGLPPLKYYRMVREKKMPQIPDDCHAGLRQIIEKCWQFEPEKRPTFSEIVRTLQGFIG